MGVLSGKHTLHILLKGQVSAGVMAAGYAIVLHRLLVPLHQLLLDLLRGMPAILSGRLQQPAGQ